MEICRKIPSLWEAHFSHASQWPMSGINVLRRQPWKGHPLKFLCIAMRLVCRLKFGSQAWKGFKAHQPDSIINIWSPCFLSTRANILATPVTTLTGTYAHSRSKADPLVNPAVVTWAGSHSSKKRAGVGSERSRNGTSILRLFIRNRVRTNCRVVEAALE